MTLSFFKWFQSLDSNFVSQHSLGDFLQIDISSDLPSPSPSSQFSTLVISYTIAENNNFKAASIQRKLKMLFMALLASSVTLVNSFNNSFRCVLNGESKMGASNSKKTSLYLSFSSWTKQASLYKHTVRETEEEHRDETRNTEKKKNSTASGRKKQHHNSSRISFNFANLFSVYKNVSTLLTEDT